MMSLEQREITEINRMAFEVRKRQPQIKLEQALYDSASNYIRENKPELYSSFTNKFQNKRFKNISIATFNFELSKLEFE